MKVGCVVVAVLVLSGCAEKLPDGPGPTPVSIPQRGVPTRIELTANPGLNGDAGTGTITARVFDAFATPLSEKTVAFTASEGTLSPAQAVTDDQGFARTSITAPAGAAVAIAASTGGIEQKTQIAMQSPPPAPRPPSEPLPPPPPPPTTTTTIPPQGYGVSVSASPSTIVVNNNSTLAATVTPQNGAPAPSSYAWDCDADGATDFTTTVNFQTCTYATAGTINSEVRVTGGRASGSGTVSVVVAPLAPLLVGVTAAPTGTVATGAPVTFTATLSSTGGASAVPVAGVDWEWDTDGDGTYDFASASHGSTDARTVDYSAPKEFTLKVRATDTATGRTAVGTRPVKVQ